MDRQRAISKPVFDGQLERLRRIEGGELSARGLLLAHDAEQRSGGDEVEAV